MHARTIACLTGVALVSWIGAAGAGIPDPLNSTCPPFVTVTADGSACFDFIVRDFLNNPIAGATVVVDFTSCPITFCPTQPHTGSQVVVVTNFSGVAHFCICGVFESECPPKVTATADGVTLGCALEAPQLRVDLVGRDSIRASYPAAFDVVVNNQGNVDAVAVPVWLTGIPLTATVELGFPLTAPHRDAGEPDWTLDSLTFTSPTGRYLALVIPRIPARTAITRRINLTVPPTVPQVQLAAAVAPQWAHGNVFSNCLVNAGVITNPSCVATQLTTVTDTLASRPELDAMSGIGIWSKVAWQCEGAASLIAAQNQARQILGYMRQIIETNSAPYPCGNPFLARWRYVLRSVTASSLDPSDKNGALKRLSISQYAPYTVSFENASSAAYAARHVVVLDTIDVVKLNPATIELGDITIARTTIHPPDPKTIDFRPPDVHLRPTMDVRIQVTINHSTGFMMWDFMSIDPITHNPPAEVDSGFLLKNLYPPLGQGTVKFTVKPWSSLTTGTTIPNSASVNFDGSIERVSAQPTTVDNAPPTSNVLPRPTTSDSIRFSLKWQSAAPDIKDYNIYATRDGGQTWWPWRRNTPATADTFAGQSGVTYAFYSIARDTCNNSEPPKTNADIAGTLVTSVPLSSPGPSLKLEAAEPNPTRGAFRVWFTLPNVGPATLDLLDVTGRRVLRRDVGRLGPGRHLVTFDSERRLKPGIYSLLLTQGGRVVGTRVTVIQ